jgi:hypothetical protein
MAASLNTKKSLQELERQYWGEPNPDTPMVRKCYALRKKPLHDLSMEELRLAIGQQIGLKFLIPLAISHLSENILAHGDFAPGDILRNIWRVPAEFWSSHRDIYKAAAWVSEPFFTEAEKLDDAWKEIYLSDLRREYAAFKAFGAR